MIGTKVRWIGFKNSELFSCFLIIFSAIQRVSVYNLLDIPTVFFSHNVQSVSKETHHFWHYAEIFFISIRFITKCDYRKFSNCPNAFGIQS